MNKSALIITLIIVGVVATGIWTYDKYFNTPEETIWDLVPEGASIVYEPQDGLGIIEKIENTSIWTSLTSEEEFEFIPYNLSLIDSISKRESIDNLIRDGGLLITVNPVSGTDFDYLYLVNKRKAPSLISQFIESLQDGATKVITERNYNGYIISEIPSEERDFSFSSNEDYWWGSYSSFLTEDVIRQLTEEGNPSFQTINPEPFFNTRISKDAGNLFFNYKELSSLFSSFMAPHSQKLTTEISNIGKSAFLDVDIKDELVLMTGFSYYRPDDFLATFEAKTSGTSNIKLYIPSQTAYYVNYFSETFEGILEDQEISGIVGTLSGEVAVAVLENSSLEVAERIAFIRSNEISKTGTILKDYASKMVQSIGDTLYYEEFSDRTIIELRKENFVSKIAPYYTTDSERSFYTLVDNLVVISSSIQTLKKFLLDVETENTWGKSVKKNSFYDNTLEESSISVFVDVNRSWNYLIDNLHPLWGDHFEANASTYRNFDLAALQFSYTDKKFFTNIAMSYSSENSSLFTKRKRLDPDISIELDHPVVSRPKVVINHNNPEREVIIQTEDNGLSLISPSKGILWSDSLRGRIKDDISQIDYYKNGKLQYAFATDSAIHIVDREGNPVEGFPKKVGYIIDHFNVIDYDNSKRYRFATSDIRGNMYLYDKEGKNLDGWKGKDLKGRLAIAPYHVRVRGSDIIVAVQERGRVNLMNRRGEMLKGFPLEFGPDLQPVFDIEVGGAFSSTILTFITKDGLLSRYTLEGKMINSQQMFRASKNVEFDIVPEYLGKGFIIVSKDISTFLIIDSSLNEIFRGNLISTRPFEYQYYNFGSDRKLYVVTDPDQEFSYLYDRYGNLINNSPINSKFDISVLFSERNNEYKIYTSYENKVSIYSF